MFLAVLATTCLSAGCSQAAKVSAPEKRAVETSVTAGSMVLTLRVTPSRAISGQKFTAELELLNTSRTSTVRFLAVDMFVQVTSPSGEVVFDSGAGRLSTGADPRVLEIRPGSSARETIRFRLKTPGDYSVRAYVDNPPPMETAPVRVTVIEQSPE